MRRGDAVALTVIAAIIGALIGSEALAQTGAASTGLGFGSPMDMVTSMGEKAKGSGLAEGIKALAMGVAVSGFFVRLYAAFGTGSTQQMRGVIVQAVGVAFMLSVIPQVNGALASSYDGAYRFANTQFGPGISSEIGKAGEAMKTMIQKAAIVGTVGAVAVKGGGALFSHLGLGSKTEGAASAAGGMSDTIVQKAGSVITAAATFIGGFLVVYSSIIGISGFIILAVGYVLPLAIALTIWGQVTPLWTCVGSALGAVLIAVFMPLMAAGAIERAFIEPARIAAANAESITVGSLYTGAVAAATGQSFNGIVAAAIRKCETQAQGDVQLDCLSPANSGIGATAMNKIAKAIGPMIDKMNGLVNSFIAQVTGLTLQVVMTAIYLIGALTFIFAGVQFLTSIMGGAAAYAGSVIKG